MTDKQDKVLELIWIKWVKHNKLTIKLLKDAATMAAREAEFEPYTRLGLIGQQLAQIQPGAFPTTTVGYQQSASTGKSNG